MKAKNKEFGEYIKELRLERGLKIRQLELYSGVSNSYLSQLENGKRGIPSPSILKKLSNGLKVPYEELLEKAGYLDEGNGDEMKVKVHVDDLEEFLKNEQVKWGDEILTEEQKKKAVDMLKILLEKKNSTD